MEKVIEINQIPVSFFSSGGTNPIVLVHGAGANKNYWKSLSEKVKNRATIRPDLYGHGKTPPWPSPPPYSYHHDVQLIEKITKPSLEPLDLVGHSSGGAICIEFALKHSEKVRSLVLIEPMLPTVLKDVKVQSWLEVSSAYENCHAKVEAGEHDEAAKILFEYILGDGEWERLPEKIRSWMSQNVEATLASHSKASLFLNASLSRYERLNLPVLLIYGELTRVPYVDITKSLFSLIEGARIQKISGASHNSPLTHEKQVNNLILQFWKELST